MGTDSDSGWGINLTLNCCVKVRDGAKQVWSTGHGVYKVASIYSALSQNNILRYSLYLIVDTYKNMQPDAG